jgi:hypothetical protein
MEFLPKFLTYLVGLLIVVIVVGGVALPAIWSRDPKRRKAATAVLVLLADTTRVILVAFGVGGQRDTICAGHRRPEAGGAMTEQGLCEDCAIPTDRHGLVFHAGPTDPVVPQRNVHRRERRRGSTSCRTRPARG